ncbi:MAG: ABC transporter permease [Caldilineaceae bacterium]|nr:ABC transporter permease [Caldilineaceae bacterium]
MNATLNKLLNGILGIVIALAIGAVIMLSQGYEPLASYAALYQFSLGDGYALATTLKNAAPLVLTGLSAAVAFASGPVNLGQPGQLVMGALAATAGGLYLDLPPVLMIPLLILLSMLGGAAWAGVAAWLRQAFAMSEFIVTLMLNIIADFFALWVITGPLRDPDAYSPTTRAIAASGWLPNWGQLNTSVLWMALALLATWFIFQRTRTGYEWRMGGQNPLFARLGGAKVDRNFVLIMLMTGALAGLAGGLLVMGGPHRFLRGLGANYAWDGVMIAIVANNGLIATLLYGIFFSALHTGALGMELITEVPSEIALVLQGVIVLVIVAGRETLNRWSAWRTVRRSVARSG